MAAMEDKFGGAAMAAMAAMEDDGSASGGGNVHFRGWYKDSGDQYKRTEQQWFEKMMLESDILVSAVQEFRNLACEVVGEECRTYEICAHHGTNMHCRRFRDGNPTLVKSLQPFLGSWDPTATEKLHKVSVAAWKNKSESETDGPNPASMPCTLVVLQNDSETRARLFHGAYFDGCKEEFKQARNFENIKEALEMNAGPCNMFYCILAFHERSLLDTITGFGAFKNKTKERAGKLGWADGGIYFDIR